MPNQSRKTRLLYEHFFRPRWYSVFINPYFINRRGLLLPLQDFAAATASDARVLDVGCGLKPYRSLFLTSHYTGIDIAGGGHADTEKVVDAYFDGTKIPFPDNSFDTLLCTQVLEHADNPEALVAECARVLVPGGRALFSMPFIYPEHEVPYDFRRFTRFEHTRLYKKNGFSEIHIHKTTGLFGVLGQLSIIAMFEGIPFRAPIFKALLSVFIFAPIAIVARTLDHVTGKGGPTMDYVIILRK